MGERRFWGVCAISLADVPCAFIVTPCPLFVVNNNFFELIVIGVKLCK